MELKAAIDQLLEELPEDRLREVLNFARFISQAREQSEWQTFGRQQFARAYGEDEPEYTEADLKDRTESK